MYDAKVASPVCLFWENMLSFCSMNDLIECMPCLCVCLRLKQSLSHCEMITDEGVRHVGLGACATDSLTTLELDNCPLISDAALDHLTSCAVLQRVEVYDCQLITRAGIRRLKVLHTCMVFL